MNIYIHPPYLVCEDSFHNIFVPGKTFFIKYSNPEHYSVNTYVFDHMWTFNATPPRQSRRAARVTTNVNHRVAFDISAQGFNSGDVKVTADAHESFHEDNLLHGSLDLDNNASMLVSKSKYNEVTQNILAPSSLWTENHQLSEELPRIRFDGTNYKLRLELEFGQDGISVKVSEFRATKQSSLPSSTESSIESSSPDERVDSWLFTNRLLSGIIFDEDDEPLNNENNNNNNNNFINSNQSLNTVSANPLLSPCALPNRTAAGSGTSTPITPSTPISEVSPWSLSPCPSPSLSSPYHTQFMLPPSPTPSSSSKTRRKLKGWFRYNFAGKFGNTGSSNGGSTPSSPTRQSYYSFLSPPSMSSMPSSPLSPTSLSPSTPASPLNATSGSGADGVPAFIRELDTIIPGWISSRDARAFAQLSASMTNSSPSTNTSTPTPTYDLSIPDPDIPESLPLPPPPYDEVAPPYYVVT